MMGRAVTSSVWKVAATLVILFGIAAPVAMVQETWAQEYELPVKVYACDADVELPGPARGVPLPEECRGLPDVKVTAYTEDGVPLDSCVTGDNGGNGDGACHLSLGPNGLRVYEQDTSNIPDGYHPRANVQRLFTYTEFAEIVFVNYRDGVLPEPETGDATLRIHSRVCPDGYEGDAFYADCHDNVPAQSQWVFANDAYAATGTDGNAILRDLPAGETQVYGGQNMQTGDLFFYCSETADLSIQRETTTAVVIEIDDSRHLRGTLTLEPGDDITCDWYVIPNLDRHLWSSVEHWLDDDEPDVTYHGASGDIELTLYRCPEAYAGADPAADCTAPENFATVRATGSDGREYAVVTTNGAGGAVISLSGIPVTDYWITLDGHVSIERDQFRCLAAGLDNTAMEQTIAREADRWNIDSFGDDPGGEICDWYLVPTG
jgi:hypothetical protein